MTIIFVLFVCLSVKRENDKFELIPRAGGYIRNVEVKKKCNNAETEEGESKSVMDRVLALIKVKG